MLVDTMDVDCMHDDNSLIACCYGFSGEDNSVDSDLPSDDELPESLLPDDSHNSRQTGSQYYVLFGFGALIHICFNLSLLMFMNHLWYIN